MNTVLTENINRSVTVEPVWRQTHVESLLRQVEVTLSETVKRSVLVDSITRQAHVESPTRQVEVTVTYTLGEFYIISPFQIAEETREGKVWRSE